METESLSLSHQNVQKCLFPPEDGTRGRLAVLGDSVAAAQMQD